VIAIRKEVSDSLWKQRKWFFVQALKRPTSKQNVRKAVSMLKEETGWRQIKK
jgi:hypothetical protein